jgi:hypothetical protein
MFSCFVLLAAKDCLFAESTPEEWVGKSMIAGDIMRFMLEQPAEYIFINKIYSS